MGAVAGAALDAGGKVTGITPYAINRAGGEGEKALTGVKVQLGQEGREAVSLFTAPIQARWLILLTGLGRDGKGREAVRVLLYWNLISPMLRLLWILCTKGRLKWQNGPSVSWGCPVDLGRSKR